MKKEIYDTAPTTPANAINFSEGLQGLEALRDMLQDEKSAGAIQAELQVQYRAGLSGPVTRLAHRAECGVPVLSDAITIVRGIGYAQTCVTTARQVISAVGWLRSYFSPLG